MEWWTIEYNSPHVEGRIRFFERSILGYIPIKNGYWYDPNRKWVDVTHHGMPENVRVFIESY